MAYSINFIYCPKEYLQNIYILLIHFETEIFLGVESKYQVLSQDWVLGKNRQTMSIVKTSL